jgi:hypothetical protein
MKNKNLIYIIAIVAVLFVLNSCKKEDNSSNSSSSSNISNIVQQGKWKVTLYKDNGTDETYYFSSHEFLFNSTGTITASLNSNNSNGTWSSITDDSSLKLVIDFGTSLPLNKLNNDWHIIEQTSTFIRLEDVSGGNGSVDYLNFQKI